MTLSRITTAGLSTIVAFTLSTSGHSATRLTSTVSITNNGSTSIWTRPIAKSTDTYAWNRNADPSTLILKLTDTAGATLSRGRLYTHNTKNSRLVSELRQINQLVSDAGGKLAPALPVPAATLTKRRIEAQQNTNKQLADLTQYFRISLPKGADAKALLDALSATAYVENAYAAMRLAPDPGDIAPQTPPFVTEQTYATAAPLGIDVDYVYANTDIRATGVTIADVERCWTLTHEDLTGVNADPNVLVGLEMETPDPSSDVCNHGTPCSGCLLPMMMHMGSLA
jgi:hypothetical protein